jgi:hypothetical protein
METKRWFLRCITILVVLGFMVGCATVSVQTKNIYPEPRSDQALVYFYRESKFVGSFISYNINVNDELVGAVANGTYFFVFLDPGTHTITAKTETKESKTMTVEAGETYYICCDVEMGFFAGRPELTIVNEAEGKSELDHLTYAIKPKEEEK